MAHETLRPAGFGFDDQEHMHQQDQRVVDASIFLRIKVWNQP